MGRSGDTAYARVVADWGFDDRRRCAPAAANEPIPLYLFLRVAADGQSLPSRFC